MLYLTMVNNQGTETEELKDSMEKLNIEECAPIHELIEIKKRMHEDVIAYLMHKNYYKFKSMKIRSISFENGFAIFIQQEYQAIKHHYYTYSH